jgi:hypothetical protein
MAVRVGGDVDHRVLGDRAPASAADALLAYCTTLGLDVGHLVYAKGNESRAKHVVRNAGIRIVQHALDLDQPVLVEYSAIGVDLLLQCDQDQCSWLCR